MDNIFINVNALADSLKNWTDPIAKEVAAASLDQVRGQIISSIIWTILLFILAISFTVLLVYLNKKANKNECDEVDYSPRWVLLIPILICIIFTVVTISDAIKMSYSPKFKAIENIMYLKNYNSTK